jgi:hypothetical protein
MKNIDRVLTVVLFSGVVGFGIMFFDTQHRFNEYRTSLEEMSIIDLIYIKVIDGNTVVGINGHFSDGSVTQRDGWNSIKLDDGTIVKFNTEITECLIHYSGSGSVYGYRLSSPVIDGIDGELVKDYYISVWDSYTEM